MQCKILNTGKTPVKKIHTENCITLFYLTDFISVHVCNLKGTYYAKFTFTYCLEINVYWQCVYTSTL